MQPKTAERSTVFFRSPVNRTYLFQVIPRGIELWLKRYRRAFSPVTSQLNAMGDIARGDIRLLKKAVPYIFPRLYLILLYVRRQATIEDDAALPLDHLTRRREGQHRRYQPYPERPPTSGSCSTIFRPPTESVPCSI